MSIEIAELENHNLTSFWGGDNRGGMLQITTSEPMVVKDTLLDQLQVPGFIHLTMEDASELVPQLIDFITLEAKRRQELLQKQMKELKIQEKTVFDEVCDLEFGSDPDIFTVKTKMISKFCPKV